MPAIIPLVAAAIPAVIGAVSNATSGGGGTDADKLASAGYKKFSPTEPAPDLSKYFKGYSANTIDPNQANTGEIQQDRSGEMSLADALRQQSNGQGPSEAQQMLTQGTNQNLAQSTALLAANRNSPGGLAAALAANAAAGQASAGQAAQIRGQEEQAGQQGLAAVLGNMGQQDLGVSSLEQGARQGNQQALNAAGQFNAGAQENLGQMVNQQYDYAQTSAQQEQDNLNAAIAKQNGAAALQQAGFNNGLIDSGIKSFGGAVNGWGASQAHAAGGVVGENGPEVSLVGEEGPEIILPVGRIADGTKPLDPNVRALLAHPDFQKALAEVIGDGSIPDRDKQLADLLASRGAPGGSNVRSRAAAA